MTGKTKEMGKIKQLLIMHRDGVSIRSIARVLGMDKETVNNYVNKAATIVSQLPVADWYDVLQGNTTAADAILDRIVHTAIRFELKGESMRK